MKNKVLITGGAGFVGTHLVNYLLREDNCEIVIFDQLPKNEQDFLSNRIVYFEGNIIMIEQVKKVFKKYGPFSVVYHLASAMPNKVVSDDILWKTNTIGTFNVISQAVINRSKSFIFTSSNVTWGIPVSLPVIEETPTLPLEIYGKSKIQAEKEIEKFINRINIQIFRCPVITGIGRLGLQAILYEFISENKNVYMLGNGSNKYQFIDISDLVVALKNSIKIKGFDIYAIGADKVLTLREIYKRIILYAGSTSKIISLPMSPALFILSILDKLNISPLGVYQYTMLGLSIYADTRKIKNKLKWLPKKTNLDTFIENYNWYIKNKNSFQEIGSSNFSANKSLPKMGIFRLLKILS